MRVSLWLPAHHTAAWPCPPAKARYAHRAWLSHLATLRKTHQWRASHSQVFEITVTDRAIIPPTARVHPGGSVRFRVTGGLNHIITAGSATVRHACVRARVLRPASPSSAPPLCDHRAATHPRIQSCSVAPPSAPSGARAVPSECRCAHDALLRSPNHSGDTYQLTHFAAHPPTRSRRCCGRAARGCTRRGSSWGSRR